MTTIDPGYTEPEFHALTNAEKLAIVKSLDANIEAQKAALEQAHARIAELEALLAGREEQFVAGFDQLRNDRQTDRKAVGEILWKARKPLVKLVPVRNEETGEWDDEEEIVVSADQLISEDLLKWAKTFGVRGRS